MKKVHRRNLEPRIVEKVQKPPKGKKTQKRKRITKSRRWFFHYLILFSE